MAGFCVKVIDTGIGIEPEILPRIFNAFEQGRSSITRQFGGLGLGLAITKALVEQHGGTLTAASAGKGKRGGVYADNSHDAGDAACRALHAAAGSRRANPHPAGAAGRGSP